jgi:hypothetical protein
MESLGEIVGESSSRRRSGGLDPNGKRQRSRVRNGKVLLTTDQRSVWARIMKDTYRALLVHCGGEDQVGETMRLMCRRVAVLESELCFLEDSFAKIRAQDGAPNDQKIDLYGRLADRQRRLAEGHRQMKDLPSLDDHLAHRRQ